MAFYIYRAPSRQFLADDEKSWTFDMAEAAAFGTRELANEIAERALPGSNNAVILDDGEQIE